MANIQEKILTEMLKNLGMEKSDRLISKAKEIHDIVAIKSSGTTTALNDGAKTIICIDISCELLNIPFDLAAAIKFTSMKKTKYVSNRKILMRLMNLNKKLEVRDVVLKMEISNVNVEKTAMRIYEAYKKKAFQTDLDHPQYIAMAVYQACKLEKAKVAKKGIIAISNLKPNQWKLLEMAWDKRVGSIGNFDKENVNDKRKEESTVAQDTNGTELKLKRKLEAEPDVEDYDVWAKRTLDKARAELKAGIP